jgi:hypothetical protein
MGLVGEFVTSLSQTLAEISPGQDLEDIELLDGV